MHTEKWTPMQKWRINLETGRENRTRALEHCSMSRAAQIISLISH